MELVGGRKKKPAKQKLLLVLYVKESDRNLILRLMGHLQKKKPVLAKNQITDQ